MCAALPRPATRESYRLSRWRGYVAKYATKATEALGVTLDHRIGDLDLEDLDVPAHVAELVRACWELGGRPTLVRLRLRKWAHMLGFGGHFSTKSRRYSTTLTALRRARAAYAVRRRGQHFADWMAAPD